MTLTVVNNCPYPVWSGIQAMPGQLQARRPGGRRLLSHAALPQVLPGVGPPLVWPHLGAHGLRGRRRAAPLATGDCGGAALVRRGARDAGAGEPPHSNDQTSYDVSVVDGFNVGLPVTPHEGHDNCPVLTCRKNLTETCPR
jgi:hypothetical protein